ncbi:hypothetical protein D8M30_14885, partial [Corynebacterium pseudodiphtheriticum]
LAILKAGGAYVPLDPEYPLDRLHYMIEDSGIGLLLSDAAMFEALGELPATLACWCLEEDLPVLANYPATEPPLLNLPQHQAYLIYTSGSTGKPKGVVVCHGEIAMHCQAVIERFDAAAHGHFDGPEMQAVQPLLQTQLRWSGLPTRNHLLAEALKSREGWHLFLYPFAGRQVHLGLASLLAWRVSQQQPVTFSIAVNDYGLELLSATPLDWPGLLCPALLSPQNLLADVAASLNAGELALRRFREIARIAGLVFAGYPGAPKSTRQVQASSGLFFEVFKQYDPQNLLLSQAGEEVLRDELDIHRLE